MRPIDADQFEAFTYQSDNADFDRGVQFVLEKIDEAPTLFEISDGATNGDILTAVFKNQVSKGSDIVAILDLDGFIISTFTMDWWNSPYKGE